MTTTKTRRIDNLRRAGELAAARRAELAARRAEALGTDGARRFAADLRATAVDPAALRGPL